MTYIHSLTLTAFRNYETALVNGLETPFVILIGDNGAGKTNTLEAVSLLSPGRGLRGASVADIQSQSHTAPWAVSAQIHDGDDMTRMGVGRDPQRPDKKLIRADGTTLKNQEEVGDILRAVWLTPQMDGLFLQGASERRRFFDRLVATFDGSHTGRMTRYEKATRERLNLLKDETKTPDAAWLSALENIMAETSVAIAAARLEMLGQLQKSISCHHIDAFPKAALRLNGDVEAALQHQSALNVEDMVREKLSAFRGADGQTGRTNFGIGRTDMAVTFTDKNADAAICSTGEQKALLTAIILAHAHLVAARFGVPPILLFDEICAHFDEKRRDALFEILASLNGQVWMSGQDETAFRTITDRRVIHVQDNKLL